MNDQQGRAYSKRAIPKRPSQQPEQLPSPPKRPSLRPGPPRPIPMRLTEQPEQSPIHSSFSLDEVVNRSLLAEMATVKREALRPKASLERIPYPAIVNRDVSRMKVPSERTSTPIPYPAMINRRRARKRSLLAWVTSFTFLK